MSVNAETVALQRVRELVRTGWLRESRKARGLSQSDVARAIGVTPSSVCRWESGESRPIRGRHAVALLDLIDGRVQTIELHGEYRPITPPRPDLR